MLKVLSLAALLVAGCLAAPAPATPSPLAAGLGRELHLSQCAHWEASLTVPAALDRGSVPSGWGSPDPYANLGLQGWVCERFALDRFERGPIHLVLETHDLANVPAACSTAPGAVLRSWVLTALWVDDAEVAAHLAAAYGMPARAAEVATRETEAGGVVLHDWAWGPVGAPASRATIPEDPLNTADNTFTERFFWPRGDAVAALELHAKDASRAFDRAVTGSAADPSLFAALPAFAMPGAWSPHATADGTIQLYENAACAQPA